MPVLTSEQLETLWELFKEQGVNAITWNHYELAEKTEENN